MHRLQTSCDGQRGLRAHLQGECVGAGEQVSHRDDFIGQSDSEGLLRVDYVAREQQFERCGWSDEAWQALGATIARDQAEFDLGLAHAGVFACDA